MTGMTLDEAQEFIDAYMGRYPKLAAWLKAQGDKALTVGYTESIGGRKRFYSIPHPDDRDYEKQIAQIRRWASNFPIQSTNADMLKRAMTNIYLRIRNGKYNGKKLYSGELKLVVHDEIVMECLIEETEEIKKIMEECMQEAYEYYVQGVKNKIDVAIAGCWSKV